MQRTRDIVTVIGAGVLHAGLASLLLLSPVHKPQGPQVVELVVQRPAPATPPRPPDPVPPPPRKVVVRQRTAVGPAPMPPVPVPPAPTVEPPTQPPRPVFGVSMDSLTDGASSVSVPVGNTTLIDPLASGRSTAAPPFTTAPRERPYQPVAARYIKTMPEIDAEECGRGVPYPPQARALGIQGDVILQVELDQQGHVHGARVLSGLGHGLDEAALHAIKFKCKFSPAVAESGQPAPYVIPAYTFHFELPR